MRSPLLPDCYDYVRRTYGVPAYIGVRVRLPNGREGNLVPVAGVGDQYVHVRLDGQVHADRYHPTDGIDYLNVAATAAREAV